MNAAAPALQRKFDAQIARLEEEVADLKRRRNELSLISCLPPEILCAILLLATSGPLKDASGTEIEQCRLSGYIQTLTRVSHAWRTTALACPYLWAQIDIQTGAKAQLISFLVKHAQPLPLSLCLREPRLFQYLPTQYREQFLGAVKQVLSQHEISLRQVVFSGSPEFLGDCLTIPKSNDGMHTIRMINTEVGRHGCWMTGIPVMNTIPDQNAMLAHKSCELRVLDLVGCTIPLTSPIIFSPHLTCLIINIARGCEARQVHEMLQAAPQLQTTHLKFPDNLVSPESASFLPKVHPRHLRELFLAGVSVSVLAVLEQFRFTLTQVKILLFVSVLPTPGNPREVGRRLFEVLGKALLPSDTAKDPSDSNRPFSPNGFGMNFIKGHGYKFHTQCWGTSSSMPPTYYADVVLFDEVTGTRLEATEWIPMLYAQHPEDLHGVGWSFASLTEITITNLHETYPRDTFWAFISRLPRLHHIMIAGRLTPEFLPTLFTGREPTLYLPATFPLPYLRSLETTGTSRSGAGLQDLVEQLVGALEKRRQRALKCHVSGTGALESLTLHDCRSPPATTQTLLAGVRSNLVKHIFWR